MTVWDLKALCEQKIKDEQLTEEQRNAWQNALKSVEINLKERETHEEGKQCTEDANTTIYAEMQTAKG